MLHLFVTFVLTHIYNTNSQCNLLSSLVHEIASTLIWKKGNYNFDEKKKNFEFYFVI